MAARRSIYVWLLCVGIVGVTAACRSSEAEAQRYQLQGQILAIRPAANEVLIKHGDIKHFMPGMTMPFKVRDSGLLAGKAAGDLVSAELVIGRDEAWLATLEKTGSAPLDAAETAVAASFVRPIQAGDPVPDTVLTDQEGRSISLPDLRHGPVVLTFIYVRCPLPQYCPSLDRRFVELQRAIKGDPALSGRVRLLSVSFDPDHDIPPALKAHAAKVGADPSMWRFATAPRDVVDRFAASFGVNVIREADQTITHNLRTVVIDPEGRVAKIYDSTEWTVAQLLDDLRRSDTH